MDTTLNPSADEIAARDEAFALWNPTAAALWSLLLSAGLGAWLLARNWERLGHPGKARQARGWFFLVIGFNLANLGLVLAGARFEWEFNAMPGWISLAIFGLWCCLSAYPQIKYADEHIGEGNPRRSWAAPLVIAVVAILLFFAVTALLANAVA
jgi:uncharacterized membrane protein YidH (DUF202 family)